MSVLVANVFVDGITFVLDNRSFVGEKTLEHLALSGAAIGISPASEHRIAVTPTSTEVAIGARGASSGSSARIGEKTPW